MGKPDAGVDVKGVEERNEHQADKIEIVQNESGRRGHEAPFREYVNESRENGNQDQQEISLAGVAFHDVTQNHGEDNN